MLFGEPCLRRPWHIVPIQTIPILEHHGTHFGAEERTLCSMAETTTKRVAFVTGASRGIGKAIALRLARDGRHVVLVSRSEGPLSEVRSLIEQAGGAASVKAADVGDGAALAK